MVVEHPSLQMVSVGVNDNYATMQTQDTEVLNVLRDTLIYDFD